MGRWIPPLQICGPQGGFTLSSALSRRVVATHADAEAPARLSVKRDAEGDTQAGHAGKVQFQTMAKETDWWPEAGV